MTKTVKVANTSDYKYNLRILLRLMIIHCSSTDWEHCLVLEKQDKLIEQKGMTFNHDFGYSFFHFSSLLKQDERMKEEWISKNRDQKSRLSARSD